MARKPETASVFRRRRLADFRSGGILVYQPGAPKDRGSFADGSAWTWMPNAGTAKVHVCGFLRFVGFALGIIGSGPRV